MKVLTSEKFKIKPKHFKNLLLSQSFVGFSLNYTIKGQCSAANTFLARNLLK